MQQWHQFLQNSQPKNSSGNSQHLIIEGSKVISFDDPIAERQALVNGTVICDLSHLGLLAFNGADVISFLQGQVTNDIKLLNGNNAHYTGYCNPKGRLLALFLAFSHLDHVHLQMPKELLESIAKRLKMYVMRSKVEIQDVSESMIKFGINGTNAAELLTPIFDKIPRNDYELVSVDKGTLLKLPSVTSRYEIFTDTVNAPIIWNALAKNAKPVGAACWDWLEIQAGIPEVTLKTQEEFVPQMLNYESVGGISFKKGCYPGQEVVARSQFRGTLKRRAFVVHTEGALSPGQELFASTDAEQPVGLVVQAAKAPQGGWDAIVCLQLAAMQPGSLHVGSSTGSAIVVLPLPYPLLEDI